MVTATINSSSSHPGSVLRQDNTTAPSAGCVQSFYFCPGHIPCRCSGSFLFSASSVAVPLLTLAPHPPGQLYLASRHVVLAGMEGTLEELAAMEEHQEMEEHVDKEELAAVEKHR